MTDERDSAVPLPAVCVHSDGWEHPSDGTLPCPVATPLPRVDGPVGKPREWTLEICRTCGRKANWPFCEHRTDRLSDPHWTETVRAREVGRRVRRRPLP